MMTTSQHGSHTLRRITEAELLEHLHDATICLQHVVDNWVVLRERLEVTVDGFFQRNNELVRRQQELAAEFHEHEARSPELRAQVCVRLRECTRLCVYMCVCIT
jgi:hypothetical protein